MFKNNHRFIIFLLLPLLWAGTAFAQPQTGYEIIRPQSIESKNFYCLSLLQYFNEAGATVRNDDTLAAVAVGKRNRLKAAETVPDIIRSLQFTREEIQKVGNRLKILYRADNALGTLVSHHLIPSGCYYKYGNLSGGDLLAKAWEQDAAGINHVIDVYGMSQKPRYPALDSANIVFGSKIHNFLIAEGKRYLLELSGDKSGQAYTIPLQAALLLLDLNDRNEPVAFEPLSETENRKCCEYISGIDWDRYPYSLILTLGAAPGDDFPLSPTAKLRLRMMSLKFRQGVAPLIIVSGGRVWPYKTRNCEAFYMKKYLIEECHVPEHVILIEPHARHTTTNIRNSVRIMFRRGIPMDKQALISSSENHISSVVSDKFAERCRTEMGLIPYVLGNRISEQFVEFYPQIQALHINPLDDPLDP
jgi:hypothetical protein